MNYIEIKTILSNISDPVEKLEFVMDMGKNLPPIPDGCAATEIRGCASRVDLCRSPENHYYGSADSALVRGIVAILLSAADGKNPAEIRSINLRHEFESLNLNLGAGRMNGVDSMIGWLEDN